VLARITFFTTFGTSKVIFLRHNFLSPFSSAVAIAKEDCESVAASLSAETKVKRIAFEFFLLPFGIWNYFLEFQKAM
jgi:hypothetical protein